MAISKLGFVLSFSLGALTDVWAADYFREVRETQTADDELVLLNLDQSSLIPFKNWNDASDEMTAKGHCFGIVHLEQVFAAKGGQLFETGTKDSPDIIESKLIAAASGQSFEPISGYSNLSEFLQSAESQEILKRVIRHIQSQHRINGQVTADSQLPQKLTAIVGQSQSSPAPQAIQASVAFTDESSTSKTIESQLRSGKSLHLFIRKNQEQWGHSVQVVGFMKSRSTGELKLIVKDSNSPDRLRVMSQKNGQWHYALESASTETAVEIAVVDDGLSNSIASRPLLAKLPAHEKSILASTHDHLRNPMAFSCPSPENEVSGFMSGINQFMTAH